MKLKLTFQERMGVIPFFPEKANQFEMEIYDSIEKKIRFKKEELETLKEHTIGNSFETDFIESKENVKGFEFERAELKLLKDRFNELNSKHAISMTMSRFGKIIAGIDLDGGKKNEN